MLNGLTKIEEVVIRAAARLLTALEYREENPGGDFRHYLEKIPLEFVGLLYGELILSMIYAVTAVGQRDVPARRNEIGEYPSPSGRPSPGAYDPWSAMEDCGS